MINQEELEKFLSLSLEERLKKSQKYKKQNKRVPVVLVNKEKQFQLNGIKYLIPKNYTVTKLIQMIKKNNKIQQDQSLVLYINKVLLNPTQQIDQLALKYLSEDGFLYITIKIMPTFGNLNQTLIN